MASHSSAEKSISILQALIKEQSYSGQEKRTADIIEAYLHERGIITNRHINNVWAVSERFDSNKKTIVLNSHHDTVKVVDGWSRDPFGSEIHDGILYGLGSNDAGASLVTLMEVFCQFYAIDLPFNLCFIASAEEENFGPNGVSAVIPKLDFELALAIVGEPTEMRMAIAEMGLIVIDATTRGKSGHAARDTGINAIYLAMEDIKRIQELKFDRISAVLGSTKATVTLIKAGTQHNVIPDSCHYVIDVRINECYTLEEVMDLLNQLTRAELKPRSLMWRSSGIELTHPLIAHARSQQIELIGSPTLSDQVHFKCPSIKMGPGQSERSHTADEYIYLSEIAEAIKIYTNLLQSFQF